MNNLNIVRRPYSIAGNQVSVHHEPSDLCVCVCVFEFEFESCRRLYKLTKLFSGQAGGAAHAAPLAIAEEGRGKVRGRAV